jgi:hypothetical protein
VAQITIHLDKALLALVQADAKAAGISPNQWIAEAIRRRVKTEWPASVLALAGAWPDFPAANTIRKQTECSL